MSLTPAVRLFTAWLFSGICRFSRGRGGLAMPRQNRVTPYGELIAVPDRGTFWGNRGALLDRPTAGPLLPRAGLGDLRALVQGLFTAAVAAGRPPSCTSSTRPPAWPPATGRAGNAATGITRRQARLVTCSRRRPADEEIEHVCTATSLPDLRCSTFTGRRWPGSRREPWWKSAGRRGWSTMGGCWPGRRVATGRGPSRYPMARRRSSPRGPPWPCWRRDTGRCIHSSANVG